MIGTTLSHFKVTAKLGEGGMGEVYRAEDTKLGREVAIKVLPAAFTENAERLARFEREAHVLASLNHPNIAGIHQVEEVEGTHFLVMELVEGEDLSQRLFKGRIPVGDAVTIALQIAEALETAHRRGIVHRDIKPSNIKITPQGDVKLLDFGLAKAQGPEPVDADFTHSPTLTAGMTRSGAILGTAAYMSPEQARGEEAGKQADVWAFGCVLYEMLTGKGAFGGKSLAEALASVLEHEPDWEKLPKDLPLRIAQVLRRCLQRELRDRLHDIADARIELEEAIREPVSASEAGRSTPRGNRRMRLAVWGLGAVVLALSVALLVIPRSAQETAILRSDLVAPAGLEFGGWSDGNIRLAPTGDRLAYVTSRSTGRHLVVHSLARGETEVLEGTGDSTFPFWSPDGRWLAFFADQKLKKVASDGGPVQILADAPAGRGGTWNREGTIVFAANIQEPLMRVSESGGTPKPVTTTSREDEGHRNPHFLPDGEHFLFTERVGLDEPFGSIEVGSIRGGAHSTITERGSNPQWSHGYLFFVRDGNLVAQRFDPRGLEVHGPVRPIADRIDYYNPRDIGNFSVSTAGLLVYRQRAARKTQVAWFGRDGRELATVGEPALIRYILSISDDESRAALMREDETGVTSDIWIMDMQRGQMARSTFVSTSGFMQAAFSSSGERLAVSSDPTAGSPRKLWLQPSSGGGAEETLLESKSFDVTDWSTDGRYVVGGIQGPGTGFDVACVDLEEGAEIRTFAGSEFLEIDPDLSPDGKWLAYISDETGRREMYVADFPLGRRKWLVSRAVESETSSLSWRWSFDGRTLYYEDSDGIYEVAFGDADPPIIGVPELIVAHDRLSNDVQGIAGVVGDRLLGLKYATRPAPEPLRLLLNWQLLLGD